MQERQPLAQLLYTLLNLASNDESMTSEREQQFCSIPTSTSSSSTSGEYWKEFGIERYNDDSRGSVAKTSSLRVSSNGSTISALGVSLAQRVQHSRTNLERMDDEVSTKRMPKLAHSVKLAGIQKILQKEYLCFQNFQRSLLRGWSHALHFLTAFVCTPYGDTLATDFM